MTRSSSPLVDVLVTHYDFLISKLTRRLGSRWAAEEALHDAYVKISGRSDPEARNPVAYVMRAALNAAFDRRTIEERRKTEPDEDAVLAAVDDRPDPERVAAGVSQWRLLETTLKELPDRRRAIFLAAWVEEIPYAALAERYDVTVRTIQIEVRRALEHCALVLQQW